MYTSSQQRSPFHNESLFNLFQDGVPAGTTKNQLFPYLKLRLGQCMAFAYATVVYE